MTRGALNPFYDILFKNCSQELCARTAPPPDQPPGFQLRRRGDQRSHPGHRPQAHPDVGPPRQSVSREQIIHSILTPSERFAPQCQAWFAELKDRECHQGLRLDHKKAGGIEPGTTDSLTRAWKGSAIESHGVLPRSLMPDGLENAMTAGNCATWSRFWTR